MNNAQEQKGFSPFSILAFRLVTIKDASTHMPNVYEKVIGEVPITTLNNRCAWWCALLNDQHRANV